jgi:glycosyltransferase involved in cell wall biosynthesis
VLVEDAAASRFDKERSGKRPKVLRIIARLNVGGPARHVVLLNRGLRDCGYETRLVFGSVAPGEASLESVLDDAQIPAIRLAALGPRVHALADVRALWSLLRIVFREQPDIIHTHTAKAGTLGRVAATFYNALRSRSRRAVVIHTFHGHVLDGYFSRTGNYLVRTAERFLGALTDRIIAISPRQWIDIAERFQIAPAHKIVTIPLGLNLEIFLRSSRSASDRERFGIQPGDFAIGYVGRFVPIKDLTTLVDAFAKVVRDLPQAKLVLAGDGPTRGPLSAQIHALGISDRVIFLGWTHDLPALYASLDVCLLTSLNEGTPVAAIEAMAAGTVVIATNVGGVPDVIAHERTGWLVEPRNPEALAQLVIMIARDPGRRRLVAEAARADVARRFTTARLVADIDRLYRDALSEKRGTIVRAT